METEGLEPCSQELAIGAYCGPHESSSHPHILFHYNSF